MSWLITATRYLLNNPREAVGVALLCSVLPVINWAAPALVALFTLRQGPAKGGIILLWVMLPALLLAGVLKSQFWLYAIAIAGGYTLTYLLAAILYYTANWGRLLDVLAIVGISAVTVIHWRVPAIEQFWLAQFQPVLSALVAGQPNAMLALTHLATVATGIQVISFSIASLWNVGVARWLQSITYNPGQFKPEMQAIRLYPFVSAIMLVNIVASILGYRVALDALPIIGVIGLIGGLSIIGFIANKIHLKSRWYIVFWVNSLFTLPFTTVVLVLVACIDSFFNLRKYFLHKNP